MGKAILFGLFGIASGHEPPTLEGLCGGLWYREAVLRAEVGLCTPASLSSPEGIESCRSVDASGARWSVRQKTQGAAIHREAVWRGCAP